MELLLEEILLINDIFFIELETHNFYKNMTGYGYGSKKVGYKFIKEKYELNKNNREDFNFTKYYDSYHEEERQLCYNLKPKRIRESIKKKIINDNDVRKLYPFY